MPTKNSPNDFQEQAEKIVKKEHNKKVYLIIAIIFIAIVLGLLVGVFAVVKNYDLGDIKPLNNETAESIDQETKNYYDLLEKKCAGDGCCLSSLDIMRQGNYKEADGNGKCPKGFNMNMIRCRTAYQWCVPDF